MDHLFSAATHSSLEVLPGFGGPGLRAHGEAADRGGGGEQPPADAQGLDQRDDMQLEKAGVDHHFVLAATSSNPSPLSQGSVLKSYYLKLYKSLLLWSTSISIIYYCF